MQLGHLNYRLYRALDKYLGISLSLLFYPFNKIIFPPKAAYHKILIIKLGLLGDAILLLPSIRALRNKYQGAQIVVLCSAANAEIFKNSALINETIAIKFKDLTNPFSLLALLKKVREYRFDLAIDFEQWMRLSALFSFLSLAPERLGFKTEGQLRHLLFNKTADHNKNRHEMECFLTLLEPLGIEVKNPELSIFHVASHIPEAGRLLDKYGVKSDFIVFHCEVSTRARQRQWPIENFIKLGSKLTEKHNFKILIPVTHNGLVEAKKIKDALGEKVELLVDVPLSLLSAVLSKARLVIANNTGVMHLAAASGTRVIGLHGPTSVIKWGPAGEGNIGVKSRLSCSPCLYLGFEYGCRGNKCMRAITLDEVLAIVERELQC